MPPLDNGGKMFLLYSNPWAWIVCVSICCSVELFKAAGSYSETRTDSVRPNCRRTVPTGHAHFVTRLLLDTTPVLLDLRLGLGSRLALKFVLGALSRTSSCQARRCDVYLKWACLVSRETTDKPFLLCVGGF